MTTSTIKIGMALAGIAGASLAISISAAQIAAALLLVLWAARCSQSTDYRLRDKSWLDAALLAFFLWGLVASGINQSTTLAKALRANNAILLFYLFRHGLNRDEVRTSVKWFLIGCAVQGFWGVLQHFSQIHNLIDEHRYEVPSYLSSAPQWAIRALADWQFRSAGSRSHPLTYAEGLVPAVFLFPVYLSFNHPNARTKILVFAGMVLVLCGILFSQGRGVWVGLGLGIALTAFFTPRGSWPRKFSLMIILMAALMIALSPRIRNRMMSIVHNQGDLSAQQSKSTRIHLWRQSLESIEAHPLTGVGLEGARFDVEHPVYHHKEVWTESHNIFLQTAVETGVIGLLLFLGILALVVKSVFEASPLIRVPALATLSAFLLMGLTESWLNDKEVAMIFWWLIGCTASFQNGKGSLA